MNYTVNYSIEFFLIIELLILFSCLKSKHNLFIFFISSFAVYLGFRNVYTTDTYNYVNEYLTGTGGYFSEKGFKYLSFLIYKLNFSTRAYLVIISLLNMFLYWYGYKIWYKNNIKHRNLVIWIFIFNSTFLFGSVNILRQSLAGGFFLISLALLCKKNMKKISLIFLILGLLFHLTLIFLIPLWIGIYLKLYKNLNIKKEIYMFLFTIFLSFLLIPFFLKIPKFYRYFYNKEIGISFYFKYLLTLSSLYLLKYLKNSLDKKIISFIIFYTILLLTLFINFKLLPSRLIYYSNIFIPILVEKYYLEVKQKRSLLFLIQIYHMFVLIYPSTRVMFQF